MTYAPSSRLKASWTKLEWKSPHARLYVDVKDEKGEIVNWNFELGEPEHVDAPGWKRGALQPGDRVKVGAAPARNFPAIGIATSMRDGDDKALFTGTTPIYEPEGRATDGTTTPAVTLVPEQGRHALRQAVRQMLVRV